MAFEDLREYLKVLKERGLLIETDVEVEPVREIPVLAKKIMKEVGKAVLFSNVKGYRDWRVVINIFGSMEMMKIALGYENLEEIGRRFLSLLERPKGLSEKIKKLGEALNMARLSPQKVRKGPVLEVKREPDLLSLPSFKTWPKDGGRYLTYALTFTKDPETDIINFGVYRIMIYSPKRAVIHWQVHKRGAQHYLKYKRMGMRRMPVAIVIGGDPVTLWTGAAPVPEGLDKLTFSSIVRGSPMKVVETSNGLRVPAYAEALLLGYVDTEELAWEGPFGDHNGFYTPRDLYPVFHLEEMYTRNDPIYYGTVVGKPYMEDAYIGKAVERAFLPLIKFLVPEVVDINLPPEGLFHGVAIVSIKKKYPGAAKKVAHALWGLGQMAFTRILIIVDDSVNVHNIGEVINAIAKYVDPQRDVEIISNDVKDAIDPVSPLVGSKILIDATRKLKEEGGSPEEVKEDPEIEKLLEEKFRRIIHT